MNTKDQQRRMANLIQTSSREKEDENEGRENIKQVHGRRREKTGHSLTISELMVLHDLSGNLYSTGLICSLNSAIHEEFLESPFG